MPDLPVFTDGNYLYATELNQIRNYIKGSISNPDIANDAAIAYSKLDLVGSIVNTDISDEAAIAYAKLNLALSVKNADIADDAAIAWSKISGVHTHASDAQGGNALTPATIITSGKIQLGKNQYFHFTNQAGDYDSGFKLDAFNQLRIIAGAGGQINFWSNNEGTSLGYFDTIALHIGHLYPGSDSNFNLGTAALRWIRCYADRLNINTSVNPITPTPVQGDITVQYSGGEMAWYLCFYTGSAWKRVKLS